MGSTTYAAKDAEMDIMAMTTQAVSSLFCDTAIPPIKYEADSNAIIGWAKHKLEGLTLQD